MYTEDPDDRETLLKELASGCDVERAIEITYKLMGNPILLFTTSYDLVAHSENPVTDEPMWNELTALGRFSHETVGFFYSEMFIDDVANSDTVAYLKSDSLKYDRLLGKLFNSDNIHMVNICCTACVKPFEPGDTELLETLCELVSVIYENSEYYTKYELIYCESFLTNLIEGCEDESLWDSDEVINLAAKQKSNLYIAIVDIVQFEPTLTHLAYFRDMFRGMYSEYNCFVYLNNIVMIISTDYSELNINRDLPRLVEFFSQNHLYAGVSTNFQSLHDLREYYRQAIIALNHGLKAKFSRPIFKYNDMRLDCFLDTVKTSVDIKNDCHPVIFTIIEHDENHGTAYFDLLRANLAHGRNDRLTTEAMGMTQDKLCEALAEMETLFDIDWDNGNMLVSMVFSIKILECLDIINNGIAGKAL